MNKEQLLINDYCPDCAKDLDTGFECNGCGKDWSTELNALYVKYDVEQNFGDLCAVVNLAALEN